MKVYIPPPDKSITIRALIFAALAEGKTKVFNPLFCDDTKAIISCLKKLKVKIEIKKNYILVHGGKLSEPKSELNCSSSAAAARILCGLCAGQNFKSTITGSEQLLKRPMKRVLLPLALMGAKTKIKNTLPVTFHPARLHGIEYNMPVASAQLKTAILTAGLFAGGKTKLIEPSQSRNHTELILKYFGAKIKTKKLCAQICSSNLTGHNITIPNDISSAAPFIVTAILLKKRILIKNVGINKTRMGLINVLKKAGAKIKIKKLISEFEPCGDIEIGVSDLKSFSAKPEEIPSMIDEVILLAVAAAFINGKNIIAGVEELAVKESDRVKACRYLLKNIGVVSEYKNGKLIILGNQNIGKLKKQFLAETFNDHRVAMAAQVLSALIGNIKIKNKECVKKSYPDFFKDFKFCFQK